MRVAVVVPSLHGGGAEFVASQWSGYLRSVGDSVTVLATHAEALDECTHVPGTWFGARLRFLRGFFKRESFDVVLSMAPHWNLLAILSVKGLARRPLVFISGRTIEAESRRMRKNKRVEIWLAKRLYRLADGFIAISHATAAEAQGMFAVPIEKLWVIPNPAIAKVQGSPSKEPPRGSDVSVTSTLNLIVPGRLVPGKRPGLALRVAEMCAQQSGRKVVLHFFGRGDSQPEASNVESSGIDVNFHGWVEDWFNQAPAQSVVLLPSRIEGFANVLVEAAAVGIPSVASSRALGVADSLLPGLTGVLVLSDSVTEYAAAVLEAEGLRPMQVDGWLQRFSLENSGRALRRALVSVR